VERAGAHLDVVGLKDHAASSAPISLEAQNQFLEAVTAHSWPAPLSPISMEKQADVALQLNFASLPNQGEAMAPIRA
jgi:hypothetical protein